MLILSIDTSCDETAAAVTEDTKVLSNVIWSQASLHAKWGGVMPSLAKRSHEEHINWVVEKALKQAFSTKLLPSVYCLVPKYIDAIAVTKGPGLAIALEVGIKKAKELARKYNKPLIPVNHIEGHLLSPLTCPKNTKYEIRNTCLAARRAKQTSKSKSKVPNLQPTTYNLQPVFPALGLVVSGGNTQIVLAKKIGKYEILSQTIDDALGESLDKSARLLGFGYPGGAILEKFAKLGNPKAYPLPLPFQGDRKNEKISYSGLKTAFVRLVEKEKAKNEGLTKEQVYNLAASYQSTAFEHLLRVLSSIIRNSKLEIRNFLVGGGVSANMELRKRLRNLAKKNNIEVHFPYSKKLCGDNAAMIGVAAYLSGEKGLTGSKIDSLDREPRLKF